MDIEPNIECPCCGYISLNGGDHGEICPICFWEHDYFVGYKTSINSDSNHGLTLAEAKVNFEKYGACEEEMVKNVIPAEARNNYKHISDEQ